MNHARIEAIHKSTAYPDSVSVQQALYQVWNECSVVDRQEPGFTVTQSQLDAAALAAVDLCRAVEKAIETRSKV